MTKRATAGRGKNQRRHGGGRGPVQRRGKGGARRGPGTAKPQRYEGLPSDEELEAEARALEEAERARQRSGGTAEPRPASSPRRTPAPPPPNVNVVKTGSVDRHLADDTPVDHDEPVIRPRSYRDLDVLPEFDE